MRSSVQYALEEIQRRYSPGPDEGWMLIPADHPVLVAEVLDHLIDYWQHSDDLIFVPTYQQQRGHPTFFRWKLTSEVFSLPAEFRWRWCCQHRQRGSTPDDRAR